MARNPYVVLGVAPTASDSDIRSAFRKLAKQYHPDRNPGDKRAEDKFKEVASAFDIIGDADRRKKFDRGEIDADGKERASAFHYRDYAGARGGASSGMGGNPFSGGAGMGSGAGGPGGMGGGARPGPGDEGFADLSDIFADLFGSRPRDGRSQGFHSPGQRGRDLRYRLDVDFLDAARGAKKRVTMPDGRSLDITIPAGLEDGQTLRLKGQGEPGVGSGQAGDVYVEVKVTPHDIFEREGLDIHVEAPITLKEAVLGGKITVPTISGDVAVTVPKGANSGAVLRLRGRGLKPNTGDMVGDQFVTLKIVLPEGGDKELEDFVRQWSGGDAKPRKHFADV